MQDFLIQFGAGTLSAITFSLLVYVMTKIQTKKNARRKHS